MAKRDWPLRYTCAHAGCKETATYRYATRRDLEASYELRVYGVPCAVSKWKCVRHTSPDQVLSATNPSIRFEATSRQEDYGRFFGSSGFVHGPGFKLFAEDVPAGTKLVVTATIEFPAQESPP